MPTQTFYNLPREKRQKLLDAIHTEFARVPYDEVSINQIVRTAGISRGSFYQYFEDKRDMLEYLLSDYRQMAFGQVTKSLSDSGGDLFAVFLDMLDFTYTFVAKDGNHTFIRNVFTDLRFNTKFLAQNRPDTRQSIFRDVLPAVDTRLLNIQSPSDLENMIGILALLTGEAFAQIFFDTSRYEQVRAQYIARLALLRRGFLKNKEDEEPVCSEPSRHK